MAGRRPARPIPRPRSPFQANVSQPRIAPSSSVPLNGRVNVRDQAAAVGTGRVATSSRSSSHKPWYGPRHGSPRSRVDQAAAPPSSPSVGLRSSGGNSPSRQLRRSASPARSPGTNKRQVPPSLRVGSSDGVRVSGGRLDNDVDGPPPKKGRSSSSLDIPGLKMFCHRVIDHASSLDEEVAYAMFEDIKMLWRTKYSRSAPPETRFVPSSARAERPSKDASTGPITSRPASGSSHPKLPTSAPASESVSRGELAAMPGRWLLGTAEVPANTNRGSMDLAETSVPDSTLESVAPNPVSVERDGSAASSHGVSAGAEKLAKGGSSAGWDSIGAVRLEAGDMSRDYGDATPISHDKAVSNRRLSSGEVLCGKHDDRVAVASIEQSKDALVLKDEAKFPELYPFVPCNRIQAALQSRVTKFNTLRREKPTKSYCEKWGLEDCSADTVRFLDMICCGDDEHTGPRRGCILTEAVGEEYRRALFTFCDKFFEGKGAEEGRILIVAPDDTWLEYHKEAMGVLRRDVKLTVFDDPKDEDVSELRTEIVEECAGWSGVLIITLETFQDCLAHDQKTHELFLDPGPDILFFACGLRLRFLPPSFVRRLRRVRTSCRFAITSAPWSSNLLEYWFMADWAVPGFFGSVDEFSECYVRPIGAGYRVGASAEARSLATSTACVLAMHLKLVCRQFASAPSYAVQLSFDISLHLHPLHVNCYQAVLNAVGEATRSGRLDPCVGARVLQVASTSTLALERMLESLVSWPKCRADDLDLQNPLMSQLLKCQKFCRDLLSDVRRALSGDHSGIQHQSSKLDVLRGIVDGCHVRREHLLVVAETEETRRAMFEGLHGRGGALVLECDMGSVTEDVFNAVEKWEDAVQKGKSVVLVTSIGQDPRHLEMDGWQLSDVTQVCLVDCGWSTTSLQQILCRLRGEGIPGGPTFFNLVAHNTAESVWLRKQSREGRKDVGVRERAACVWEEELNLKDVLLPCGGADAKGTVGNSGGLSRELLDLDDEINSGLIKDLCRIQFSAPYSSRYLIREAALTSDERTLGNQFATSGKSLDVACRRPGSLENAFKDYRTQVWNVFREAGRHVAWDCVEHRSEESDSESLLKTVRLREAGLHIGRDLDVLVACSTPFYHCLRAHWDLFVRHVASCR